MINKNIPVGLLRTGVKPGQKALAMSYAGQNIGIDIYFFSATDVDIKNKKN